MTIVEQTLRKVHHMESDRLNIYFFYGKKLRSTTDALQSDKKGVIQTV